MSRLFVALPVPDHISQKLKILQIGIPGARWVPCHNYHITLKFIGDVNSIEADDIHMALSGIKAPSCDIQIKGFDWFGSKNQARLLITRIEKSSALMHLHNKIETALIRNGFEAQHRKYTPHITLARLNKAPLERVHHYCAHHKDLLFPLFISEKFLLYSSYLSKSGADYKKEASYSLMPGTQQ